MAIISEINGELDIAIEWAQKSYENYNNKLALQYLRILKNRKALQNFARLFLFCVTPSPNPHLNRLFKQQLENNERCALPVMYR